MGPASVTSSRGRAAGKIVRRASSGRPLRADCSGCFRLGACNIRIEILETELQLIRIEPFRPTAELATLKLPDDETELLDLPVALLHAPCEIAHELMQYRRVARQIREVEGA